MTGFANRSTLDNHWAACLALRHSARLLEMQLVANSAKVGLAMTHTPFEFFIVALTGFHGVCGIRPWFRSFLTLMARCLASFSETAG